MISKVFWYFYFEYLLHRTVFIWFESYSNRLEFIKLSLLYFLGQLIGTTKIKESYTHSKTENVRTRHGRFHIRQGTMDIICVSPAYERPDLFNLFGQIDKFLDQDKDIHFFDIGANIGTYTVAVGNRYKGIPNLKIYAIEPMQENFNLLKENLSLNNLEGSVILYNSFLDSTGGENIRISYSKQRPCDASINSSIGMQNTKEYTIKSRTFDSLFKYTYKKNDITIIKVDVEGSEVSVLSGASECLGKCQSIVLVEDFIDGGVLDYLKENGFNCIAKKTPYNSWWERKPQ